MEALITDVVHVLQQRKLGDRIAHTHRLTLQDVAAILHRVLGADAETTRPSDLKPLLRAALTEFGVEANECGVVQLYDP